MLGQKDSFCADSSKRKRQEQQPNTSGQPLTNPAIQPPSDITFPQSKRPRTLPQSEQQQTDAATTASLITLMPEEVLNYLLTFLDDPSVGMTRLVCHQFDSLTCDQIFWKGKVRHVFTYLLDEHSEEPQDYHAMYCAEYQHYNKLLKSEQWLFKMEELLRALKGDLSLIAQYDITNQNALYSLAIANGHYDELPMTNDNAALAFKLAAASGRIETLQYLIFNQAPSKEVREQACVTAAEYGQVKALEFFFDNYSIKESILENIYNTATTNNQLAIMQYMDAKRNTDKNMTIHHGKPLQIAAANGSLETVKYLLEVSMKCDHCISQLAMKKARPRPSFTSNNPTFNQLMVQATQMVYQLMTDINQYKGSALKDAAANGHEKVVEYLLKNAPEISKEDIKQAEEYARAGNHHSIVTKLSTKKRSSCIMM